MLADNNAGVTLGAESLALADAVLQQDSISIPLHMSINLHDLLVSQPSISLGAIHASFTQDFMHMYRCSVQSGKGLHPRSVRNYAGSQCHPGGSLERHLISLIIAFGIVSVTCAYHRGMEDQQHAVVVQMICSEPSRLK